MEINATLFKDFIRKASFGGVHPSINLDFSDIGLRSSVRSADNQCLSIVTMKKEAFKGYEPIGEVFIKDTDKFMKYLTTFEAEIVLDFGVKHILRMTGDGREGHVILGDEIVCENVFRKEMPVIPTTAEMVLYKRDLSKTLGDISLLSINQVRMTKKDEELLLEVGIKGESDYFITKIKVIKEGDGDTKIGGYFSNLCSSIDGEFVLRIGKDIPIVVEEKSNLISFIGIIAPFIDM